MEEKVSEKDMIQNCGTDLAKEDVVLEIIKSELEIEEIRKEKEMHAKQGEKVTLWCLLGNIVLCSLKLLAGLVGQSSAMVADAIHSGSDVLATIAVYIGLLIEKKPKDECHPYGHGKIEAITSVFVGLTLLFAVYMIGKTTITSIITGEFATPTYLAVAAAVLSIVVKEFMYRITVRIGKKLNSESIIANAWDHRSDAISSVGTFIGITGSILGEYLGIGIMRYMDPIAGLIVGCIIFKITVEILVSAYRSLMDHAPDRDVIEKIRETVEQNEDVITVYAIKARFVGRHMFSELSIEIDPTISIEEGHNIAMNVKKEVLRKIEDMDDCFIHMEPKGVFDRYVKAKEIARAEYIGHEAS